MSDRAENTAVPHERPMTLRQQRDALLATNGELVERLSSLRAKVERLEQERDRYKAELERIAGQVTILIGNPYSSVVQKVLSDD